MNRVSFLAAFLVLLSACGGGEPESTESTRVVTYFEGGNVILGDGSAPIEDAALVVDDGIIIGVGPRDQVEHPPGADRYDFSGHTIIPFLQSVDGHVGYLDGSEPSAAHYSRDSILLDLDRYLYYGVGSVLSLGLDTGELAVQVRDERESGTRLLTAGRGITAQGGYPAAGVAAFADVPYQVGSADAARDAVRELAASGVNFVTLWVDDNRRITGQIFRFGRLTDQYATVPKLAPAIYQAVIDEAHQNNLRVIAHVHYLADAKGLVSAGVDGLVNSVRDRAVDTALVDAMRENNVFYVPTLTALESKFIYADEPDWLGERSMRESVSGAVIGRLSSSGIVGAFKQDPNLPMWRREYDTATENLKTLFDAGIRIGLGTESGTENRFPGYFEHREMELMVDAGLSPIDAIRIATEGSAEILGIEDMGVLAVGKRGNFLIVPGQPNEDIRATRDAAEVRENGILVERSAMMTRFTM